MEEGYENCVINNVEFGGVKPLDAYNSASNVNYFYSYAFISEQKKMVKKFI